MWIIWYIRRLQSCTQLSHIIFIFLRKETANIAHTDMPDQLWAQPGTLASSSAIAQPSTAAFAQHNRELEGDRQNHINTKCQGDLNPQYTSRHYFRCSNGDRDTLFVERFDFVLLSCSRKSSPSWESKTGRPSHLQHGSWDAMLPGTTVRSTPPPCLSWTFFIGQSALPWKYWFKWLSWPSHSAGI